MIDYRLGGSNVRRAGGTSRGEEDMVWFLVRFQLNSASAKSIITSPQDRLGPATTLVESFGGRLHDYFFAFGDFDGVIIAEFPDHKAAAAFSLRANATGGFSRFEMTVLIPTTEAEAAMKQARDIKLVYRAPNE